MRWTALLNGIECLTWSSLDDATMGGAVRRLKQGQKVRIVHEPKDGEPAHAGIRRLPRDHLTLLAALAEDAFVEMVRNGDIISPPNGSWPVHAISGDYMLPRLE